jgi:hypothetical protein
LAAEADFGENKVPRIAADFVVVQFHKITARSVSLGPFRR